MDEIKEDRIIKECETEIHTADQIKEKKTNITLPTDSVEIHRGEIYFFEENKWRVFDVRKDRLSIISLNTDEIRLADTNSFVNEVENGIYKKVNDEQDNLFAITEEEMEIINQRVKVMESIFKAEYPLIGRMKLNHDMEAELLGISRRYLRTLFKNYLRSGRNKFSLVDKRKLNSRPRITYSADFEDPKNDIDFQMRFALQEFHRLHDAKRAYYSVLRRFYREPEEQPDGSVKMVTLPEEQIPISYKMVLKYIKDHLGGLSIKQYLDSKNLQNDERQLPGDSRYGAYRLGQIMEADETELPCYCVDHETRVVIGKPVLYVLAEVKAGGIVGHYVSLENNSNLGIRQAFLSMMEPHCNQTDQYGFSYKEEEYPSMILPEEIRTDHGSEYMSGNFGKAIGEMGITLSSVPVACGSMKGVVEKFHDLVQQHMRTHLRDAGFIEKTYRGGDLAKGSACLTIEEVRELVAKAIILVNTRVLEWTPRLEYIKADIPLTPAGIYQYEKERYGDPRNVTDANRANCLYMLLAKQKDKRNFKWNRRTGIVYTFLKKNLYFYSMESWFEDLLKDEKDLDSIEVRYNENDVSCVYILYKNQVRRVPLSEKRQNQLTFAGLTWDTFDNWIRYLHGSETQKKAAKEALDRRLQFEDDVDRMVGMAKALNPMEKTKYGKADLKDKARKKEEMRMDPNEINNRMYHDIDSDKQPDSQQIEQKPVSVVERIVKEKENIFRHGLPSREEEASYLLSLIDDGNWDEE